MTHSGGKPHTNIGDRGQRYEVRATGYPHQERESVVGWAETLEGAGTMLDSFCKAPGCTSVIIYDRVEHRDVIRRYAGVLR